ncbi:hypothetical protein [Pseudonocardia sp.]|uniref:hypothetical protein n=1 Tax=Pseudonocardia sp. TaxID=60912 RepID=UPI003D12077C
MPLGREGWAGVVAGVGDLVQARRNSLELRGWQGNAGVPINRATYRVLATHEDGGLTVAPVLGRGEAGEDLGESMALPARYVVKDLTLGYASTVHAAEGRTVDTGHAVLGGGSDLPGVLVSMTRGRDSNTAWVVTTPLTTVAETGQTLDVRPRSARAVLADVAEGARDELTALAERERAEVEARSTATQLDQLISVAEQVTSGRTAAALDRLAATGRLTPPERAESPLTTRCGRWSGCSGPRSSPGTIPTMSSPLRSGHGICPVHGRWRRWCITGSRTLLPAASPLWWRPRRT